MRDSSELQQIKDEFGPWKDLITMTQAVAAYYLYTESEDIHLCHYLWQGINRGCAYDDCISDYPKLFIGFDKVEASHFGPIARVLSACQEDLPGEIVNDPLWHTIQAMADWEGYDGSQHMEVAAYFDEDLDDPFRSWDALISADYFHAARTGRSFFPIFEVVTAVVEDREWATIASFLNESFEFYSARRNTKT